jgi:hypothetical protein
MHKCGVCGKGDEDRPTIFKGEPYCCEAHRKQLAGETNPNPPETTNEVVE